MASEVILAEELGGFSTQLKWGDRLRLRAIVRKVHLSFLPDEYLTDYECDKYIDSLGPKVCAAEIERHVARGNVE